MASSTTLSYEAAPVLAQSYYPQILVAAENPAFRSKDFARLVLMQMCIACRELSEAALHPSTAFKVGPLAAHIRALRDLAATAALGRRIYGSGRCGQPRWAEIRSCVRSHHGGFS
jgi:hypothetical protein